MLTNRDNVQKYRHHTTNEDIEDNIYDHFARPWYRFKVKKIRRKNALISGRIKEEGLEQIEKNMITLDDNYRWHTSAWIVYPFSHVYKMVEEFILNCHQNGLIEHWIDITFVDKTLDIEEPPKQLKMYMLSAGFYVWLSSVAFACSIFLGELIYYSYKKLKVKRTERSRKKEKRFKNIHKKRLQHKRIHRKKNDKRNLKRTERCSCKLAHSSIINM